MAGGGPDTGRAGAGVGIRGESEHHAAGAGRAGTDGLLYSERTSGRFVTQDRAHIVRLRASLAGEILRDFLSRMEGLGCAREEILPLLQQEMERSAQTRPYERKEGDS